MKFNRWGLLVLVILVGAAIWFWSPWKAGKQSVEFDNASDIVAAAQGELDDVQNYKYKTDITVGDQIKVDLENKVVRGEPNRQMIDFSWSAPNMKGTASMYAEGETVLLNTPLNNKWEMPTEEPTLKPFMGFFWKQVKLVDPVENLLKVNAGNKNLSILTNQTEQAEDTVTVQLVPDENALSELSKSLPPQLIGAELKDIKQLFWISKSDFLVTRYEVRATVSFFGFKTMDFKTVSIPTDYDKTNIEMPQQLTDKLNQIKTP